MSRKRAKSPLPPPYLKRVWIEPEAISADAASQYPLGLVLFRGGFELKFDRPITIIVGENGSGKSTLLEGLAALAGYDSAGGGKGYRPVDHSTAIDRSGAGLAEVMRAAWLPKVTNGWFFRAESFFSVARYLDDAAREAMSGARAPDFLSHSHGEGFMRFFIERCSRHGIYYFDEPESALSPTRQLDFLRLLHRIEKRRNAQVIMATHSPILMAYAGAQLLGLSHRGIRPIELSDTEHLKMYRDFARDPEGFVAVALGEDAEGSDSDSDTQN